MKTCRIRKGVFSTAMITLLFSSPTIAEQSEPLVLQKIMFDMGQEMQNITAGISSEDWPRVEEAALKIADHPKPPVSERMRIMSLLGTEMAAFKEGDMATHQSARKLAEIAKQKNGQAVISAFSVLQNNCLSCHETYREKFQAHFYGKQ
ncbi:MAG: cytochrome c [Gammaproteobacteria bacterium]|nr:cytochrome c [Gammaproteobacteria bacterium]MCF6231368.1 cytochrome c [Gammaproteobacteria bacterium]